MPHKKQKAVSAYCWVVYSSGKSWYKSYQC